MTRQEIFEKVVAHFAAQRAVAIDDYGNCRYRTGDGRKCAVGALIPDDAYSPNFENKSAEALFVNYPEMMRSAGLTPGGPAFLMALQSAHDGAMQGVKVLTSLSKRLAEVAADYKLDPSCFAALTAQRKPQ